MSKKIQINTTSSIELDKIQFDKLYKTTNGVTKALVKYDNKPLLVRSPLMCLGTDVVKCGNDYYIDLVFDKKNKKNVEFLDLVKNTDFLVISEIFENGKLWYPDQTTEPCLCQIEKEYIPTIKLSTIHTDRYSLKLKVSSDKIEFYDGDNVEIPYQLLKEGYPTSALLQLSQVYKDGGHLWADWEVLQLKTDIPDKIFAGCQLADVEESEEEDETTEETDFY